MKNREHKNWWVIIPAMLILPFGVNWLINLTTPSWWSGGVAGEGKDWLLFWGAYVSSIAAAIMAFLTYRIIKQNEDVRQGVIAIRVIYDSSGMYCLELMNAGNSSVYNIQLNYNDNFLALLTKQSAESIRIISKSKIYLKPNESKVIVISCYAGTHEELNPETGKMDKVTITDEQITQIKTTAIEIQGSYQTIGKTIQIEERCGLYKNNRKLTVWGKCGEKILNK